MPSEQMQAFIDALRDHVPQGGSLTVEQHRAMHDALLARRPPDEDVRIEATVLGGVAAEWVWAEGVTADRVVLHCHGGGFRAGSRLTISRVSALFPARPHAAAQPGTSRRRSHRRLRDLGGEQNVRARDHSTGRTAGVR